MLKLHPTYEQTLVKLRLERQTDSLATAFTTSYPADVGRVKF
jgi:hypothetical protein